MAADSDLTGPPRWVSLPAGSEQPAPRWIRRLQLETGELLDLSSPTPIQQLPIGVHNAVNADGGFVSHISVAPRTTRPPNAGWALGVFLSNVRTPRSWGVGDFGDLAMLADWCRAQRAAYLFLGPITAGRAARPVRTSPYSPSSRLLLSVNHLRPELVPGWDALPTPVKALADRARRLNQLAHIDLDESLALKLSVLDALWRQRGRYDPGGRRHDDAEGLFSAEVERLAVFAAAERRLGSDVRLWPHDLRRPESALTSSWAQDHSDDIAFVRWCQLQLDRQLAAAAHRGPGLVIDLPVGTPPDSADCWLWQDRVAHGWELGAPPDLFNSLGHRWGLTPFDPVRLLVDGGRPFRLALRAALRHAAGIRIDHAYGLFRQCWTRAGDRSGQRRFVSQPTEALLDLICIEASRHDAFVVTEELGTPPPCGTDALRRRGFSRLAVIMTGDSTAPDRLAVITATTHDLPTVTGCWTGADDPPLGRAHLATSRDFVATARRRLGTFAGVADACSPSRLMSALHARMARRPERLLLISLADLLGVPDRLNAPGVDTEAWPSFTRALPLLPRAFDRAPVKPVLDAIKADR